MTFTIIIDASRAKEILDVMYASYGQGGDLSFLLRKIAATYPNLWASYEVLHPLLEEL